MKLNNNDDSHNSGLNLLIYNMLLDIESHPTWVCGLKLLCAQSFKILTLSHPTWVCGLKHTYNIRVLYRDCVTPYVGVWIETVMCGLKHDNPMSHPTWVCGLKLPKAIAARSESLVTPYVGVWIETSMAQYSAISKMVTPCVGIYGLEHCSLVGQVYGRTVSIRPLMYFSPGF